MPDADRPLPPLLFLSHAGIDTDAARALKQRLEAAPEVQAHGLRVWFDKDDLRAGEPWQAQLEAAIRQHSTAFAVYIGSRGVVNWVNAEVQLALGRAATDPAYRFIPILAPQAPGPEALPGFVALYQGVTDIEGQPDQFARLTAAVLGQDAAGTATLEADPFFGLKAVDEDRAHLFFGREAEVETLLQLVRHEPLVMVTGDSGSGKSSLARAGLVPRWRGGGLAEAMGERAAEAVWHVVQTQPRTRPFQALAEAVGEAAKRLGLPLADRGPLETWARSGDPAQVRRALWCDLPPDRTHVLLLVDQFEELVTIAEPAEREPFVRLLLALADPHDPRARVVLTMRRDYYNLVSAFPELYDRLEADGHRARQILGRVSPDGLRRLVTEPLRLAGVPEGDRTALADQVVAEMGDRPGDLALVQMALTETWDRRHAFGDDLLRAYAGVGRLEGAIARAAEDVYQHTLDDGERARAEPVFVRLVRLGDTGGVTRRLATRAEFDAGQWRLVQTLASTEAKRLVLVGGGETAATAEIAHEALITQWPRYQTWLSGRDPDGADRAADKRALDALIPRALDWAAAPDARAQAQYLATGADLDTFAGLAGRRPAWLSADEHQFVTDSRAHAARQQRRERWLFRGIMALAMLAIVSAGVAWNQLQKAKDGEQKAKAAEEQAKQQTRVATSRQLAAQAHNELNDHLDLSLLLSVEALQTAMTVEARQSLFKALTLNPAIETFLYRGSEPARRGVFGQDGETVALADGQSIVVFNRSQPTRAQRITDIKGTTSFVVSNDGRWVAIGTGDGDIWLWDRVRSTALGKPVKISGTAVTDMTFHKTENRLAAVSGSRLFFMNVSDSMGLQPTGEGLDLKEALDRVQTRQPPSLRDKLITAFTLDGKTLAATYDHSSGPYTMVLPNDSAGSDSIMLWDVWDQRRTIASLDTSDLGSTIVREIAISANGKTLAVDRVSVSDVAPSNYVRVYDLSDPAIMHPVPISTWKATAIYYQGSSRMAFSQDGKTLVIGEYDGTMVVFDSANRKWSSRPIEIKGVTGPCHTIVANSGNESLLVGKGETYLLWNRSANSFKTPLAKGEGIPRSIVFGDNGSTVRVANASGIVHSWDVLTGNAKGESLQVLEKGQRGTVFFSRDGQTLAAMTSDQTDQKKILLNIWSIPKRTRLGPLQLTAAKPLGFTPDGKYVVVFSEGIMRLLNITNLEWFGQPMAVYDADLQAHPPHLEPSVAFMQNGTKMAVHVINKEDLQIWDLESQQRDPGILLIGEERGWGKAPLTISPNGRTIAVHRVLFDRTTKKRIPFQDIPGSVCNLTFSHDSALLAVSYELDGAASWDSPDGLPRAAQYGVRLWDVRDQQWIDSPMDNLPHTPCLLAFSLDNKVIAVATESQHIPESLSDVVLWHISLSSWIQKAERHIVYNKIIYGNK